MDEGSSRNGPRVFAALQGVSLGLLAVFRTMCMRGKVIGTTGILGLAPSTVDRSVRGLHIVFPSPLFVHGNRNIAPATFTVRLRRCVARNLRSVLNTLSVRKDCSGRQAVAVTAAPSIKTLILPIVCQTVGARCPRLLLHGPPVDSTRGRLDRFRASLVVSGVFYAGHAIRRRILFASGVILVYHRKGPLLSLRSSERAVSGTTRMLLLPRRRGFDNLQREIRRVFPSQRVGFADCGVLAVTTLITGDSVLTVVPDHFCGLFDHY